MKYVVYPHDYRSTKNYPMMQWDLIVLKEYSVYPHDHRRTKTGIDVKPVIGDKDCETDLFFKLPDKICFCIFSKKNNHHIIFYWERILLFRNKEFISISAINDISLRVFLIFFRIIFLF